MVHLVKTRQRPTARRHVFTVSASFGFIDSKTRLAASFSQRLRPVRAFKHDLTASIEPHHSPPCLPRHTLPVSVEKKRLKTTKKKQTNKKTTTKKKTEWRSEICQLEWASICHFTLRWFPFFFLLSFCLGMILTLFLNTERIYALFWLVVVVRS